MEIANESKSNKTQLPFNAELGDLILLETPLRSRDVVIGKYMYLGVYKPNDYKVPSTQDLEEMSTRDLTYVKRQLEIFHILNPYLLGKPEIFGNVVIAPWIPLDESIKTIQKLSTSSHFSVG